MVVKRLRSVTEKKEYLDEQFEQDKYNFMYEIWEALVDPEVEIVDLLNESKETYEKFREEAANRGETITTHMEQIAPSTVLKAFKGEDGEEGEWDSIKAFMKFAQEKAEEISELEDKLYYLEHPEEVVSDAKNDEYLEIDHNDQEEGKSEKELKKERDRKIKELQTKIQALKKESGDAEGDVQGSAETIKNAIDTHLARLKEATKKGEVETGVRFRKTKILALIAVAIGGGVVENRREAYSRGESSLEKDLSGLFADDKKGSAIRETDSVYEGDLPPNYIEGSTHTIESGDTFLGLARQYGVDIEGIQYLNAGVDPTKLGIGMKIKIPQTEEDRRLQATRNR